MHGCGGIGQTADYWGNGYFDPMIRRRGGWEKTSGYCTEVFFNEAIRWMDARVAEKKPFFLHLATNAPHAPYVPPERGAKLQGADAFHAMIDHIDVNFAKLMAALEKSGAAANTVVVFMTDNGSAIGATKAGMKGKKGSPDEGGVRVPCFVRWPGKIAAGKVVPEIAAHLDLLPTLTSLCGVARPEGWTGDGLDLSAAAAGKAEFPKERMLFTQVGRWNGRRGGGALPRPGFLGAGCPLAAGRAGAFRHGGGPGADEEPLRRTAGRGPAPAGGIRQVVGKRAARGARAGALRRSARKPARWSG